MVDKTVKELRDELIKALTDAWGGHNAAAIMMVDNIIFAVEEREKTRLPVIYGIFRKGYGGALLSKVEDRADSGHCDLHYGGLIEEGKRYGLILLPEKGEYISAPIKKEKL